MLTAQDIQDIKHGTVLAHESTVSVYRTVRTVNSIESHRTGSRLERRFYTALGKPRRIKRGFSVKVVDANGSCCKAVLNEDSRHWSLA